MRRPGDAELPTDAGRHGCEQRSGTGRPRAGVWGAAGGLLTGSEGRLGCAPRLSEGGGGGRGSVVAGSRPRVILQLH